MHFMRTHLNGNPYLGMFASCSDRLLVLPPGIPESRKRAIANTLEVDTVTTTVAETELVGMFMAMNSNGAVLPQDATDNEIEALESADIRVSRLDSRFNAFGNLILANDEGAVVDSMYTDHEEELISRVLDVDVVEGCVNGLAIVGSLACANSLGVLASPKVEEEEVKLIKDTLKVEVGRGTANFGVEYVGTCILANSNGVAAGQPTTGIEMGKIEQVFEGDIW